MCVELPCEIRTPLVDQETQENETISLVLVISKPRKVTWLKNGQELDLTTERFQASVSEDGLRHVLTLRGVTKDEWAEFTASIDDAAHGIKTSSCKVTVSGMCQLRIQSSAGREISSSLRATG